MADFEMELVWGERQKNMTVIFYITEGHAILATVSQSNLLWLDNCVETNDCSGTARFTSCGPQVHLDCPVMAALSYLLYLLS